MFSHLSKLNKQTDLKEQHNFTLLLLCLYMADPATSLASNGLLGILIFLLRNSLFMQSRKNSHLTTNPVKWEQAENLLTIFAFRAVWLILFWADLRSVSVTRSFVSLPSASLVSPVCDLHALHAAVHTSDHDHALSTIKNTFVHVVVTLSLDFILHWFYQKAVLFFFPLLRSPCQSVSGAAEWDWDPVSLPASSSHLPLQSRLASACVWPVACLCYVCKMCQIVSADWISLRFFFGSFLSISSIPWHTITDICLIPF